MGEPEITLVRLSSDFDVSGFECGDDDLDEFLKEDALDYQSWFLANTTLVLCDGAVAAYFSLASDAIQLSADEKEKERIEAPFSSFPALKIARLATDERFKGMGLGSTALKFSIGLARHLNDEDRHDGIGCRFVTVDAYPKSASWYMDRGFIKNGKVGKNRETLSLRIDAMPYED